MAQNRQNWSDFDQKRPKESDIQAQVRFSRRNLCNFLPLENVFSKNLALYTLYFKYKFVLGGAVSIWEF